eukprot:m.107277 g.107277  ORF g.107277 m.107277 type:complete len:267 (+) comp37290_c0_seq1:330-1130(+)
MPDLQLQDFLKTATSAIREIYRCPDKKNRLTTDIWFHLGRVRQAFLLTEKDAMARPRLREIEKESNFDLIHFDSGVSEETFDGIKKYLTEVYRSVEFIQSYVRHDVEMYTPTNRDRRFRVFLSEKTATQGEKISGCEKYIGSKLNKAGSGLLYSAFPNWFRGDILYPHSKYDCRLIVRAGCVEKPLGRFDEKEDQPLIKKFEKIAYSEFCVDPPTMPKNYVVHCIRRSLVFCYRLNGNLEVRLTRAKELSLLKKKKLESVKCGSEI